MQPINQTPIVNAKSDKNLSNSKKTMLSDINNKAVKNKRLDNTKLGYIKTVPKGVKPELKDRYEYVLRWLCTDPEERKQKTFTELAETLQISQVTLFNWLNLRDTEAYVNEYIRKLYIAEKPRLFKVHLKQAEKSAHFAKFVAEYYENWMGAQTSARPITVVFNFNGNEKPTSEDISDKVTVKVETAQVGAKDDE